MHRYLLFFNYRGTNFRGSQKLLSRKDSEILTKQTLLEEEKTVQGALETGLKLALTPSNPPVFFLSSRTDTGVHAYSSTGTVDLIHPKPDKYFSPLEITQHLNHHFIKRNLEVRINRTLAVHPDFRARKDTIAREYLYQLAVSSEEIPPYPFKRYKRRRNNNKIFMPSQLPVFMADRYLQIGHNVFDAEKIESCLKMMEGSHNFRNFCSSTGWIKHLKLPDGSHLSSPRTEEEFIKDISSIDLLESVSPFPLPELNQYFKFYNIKISGKAFLHNQVRRMVGAALAASSGRMEQDDLKKMLTKPDLGWDTRAKPVPAHGLHLLSVTYSPESLVNSTEDVKLLPLQPPGSTSEDV
ncbi:tRNA pseudouridine synthase-like 1 isoform X2 [Eurytemora carolleeae]|uniref:tRNA pseudouridine synthase-like 1 isoform X2 n=1 Tax=Eurytemora carolleeae TaxID=1294199 RepID=UPI000C76A6AB|nr:tRNA pseudouridine synthase-like 1 isoform X2 [Eurytemora carolleeae]|eukprot:XP_023340718.1 tRNA pseudouridine synthase-like 1 isoform X2 [Eurytemora affinis]